MAYNADEFGLFLLVAASSHKEIKIVGALVGCVTSNRRHERTQSRISIGYRNGDEVRNLFSNKAIFMKNLVFLRNVPADQSHLPGGTLMTAETVRKPL